MSAKIKTLSLILFCLNLMLFISACGNSGKRETIPLTNKDLESGNKTINELSNKQNSANAAPTVDAAEKAKIEEALKKEGFKDLTVDYSTQPPTLRGNVPPEKIAIVILVAEKAAGKKLTNGLNEK
jgi:hypothetical protein